MELSTILFVVTAIALLLAAMRLVPQQCCFGIVRRIDQLDPAIGIILVGDIFTQGHHMDAMRLLERGIGRIADDLQKPGAGIGAAKGREIGKGAQHGFLHDIFRLRRIAEQPMGKVAGGIEMNQDSCLEPSRFGVTRHFQARSLACCPCRFSHKPALNPPARPVLMKIAPVL